MLGVLIMLKHPLVLLAVELPVVARAAVEDCFKTTI